MLAIEIYYVASSRDMWHQRSDNLWIIKGQVHSFIGNVIKGQKLIIVIMTLFFHNTVRGFFRSNRCCSTQSHWQHLTQFSRIILNSNQKWYSQSKSHTTLNVICTYRLGSNYVILKSFWDFIHGSNCRNKTVLNNVVHKIWKLLVYSI